MNKKIFFLLTALTAVSMTLWANPIKRDSLFLTQITTADMLVPADEWGVKWSGYLSTDIFVDTRKPVESRDGGIFLYPTNLLPDANGIDLNDRASFNFITMNTRLTLKITAPKSLGANVSGMLEGWFMGVSNDDLNGFSLRHSFIKLDWTKTHLLIGQTWHPMFTERMFPFTTAGSAGAPFQPFSRAPQIRFTQSFFKYSNIMLYCNTQRDMVSDGVDKRSTQYLRNSLMPEVGAQYILDYKKQENNVTKSEFYFGFGADFKRLTPRIKTESNIATNRKINSFTGLIFAHYAHYFGEKTKVGVKFKSTFAQNTLEFLMMGGYAIKEYHPDSLLNFGVDFDYTNLNVTSSWLDLYVDHNNWQFGVFSGFAKNLGSRDRIQSPNNTKSYYATLYNADYLFRVSPRIKYTANKIQFCFEPEYTGVLYGTKQTANGTVDLSQPTHYVSNIRFLFTTILFF